MFRITLGVEGMACGMCEAHINDAVRKHFHIDSVSSSAGKKQTVIVAPEKISESDLHAVIDPTGYRMVSYACEPYEKKSFFSRLFG